MSQAGKDSSQEKALTVAQQINGELERKKLEGYIVLTVPTIQEVPAMHRLVLKVVKPEMEMKDRKLISNDLYPQAGGSVAFRRNFYDKLAGAAGIQWVYHAFRRMDNGSNPRFCHYQAVGIIKGLEGQWVTKVADKAIDMDVMEQELRDKCWERANNYVELATDPTPAPDDDIKLARAFVKEYPTQADRGRWVEEKIRPDALQIQKHIVARAQTGAMSRVVEKALSLKKSYLAKELEKGFIFGSLVFTPDETNPIDRKFMLDEASGARSALYPASPTSSPNTPDIPSEVMQRGGMPDYDEVETLDVEPIGGFSQPGRSTTPTNEESQRADFVAGNPKEQVEVIQALIKRKGYAGKIEGDMTKWKVGDRTAFFDRLMGMPELAAASDKLPFD